jgi:predicted deacylase
MKEITLPNSKIIELGRGSPVVGIVGLVHGDECCGRKILDELVSSHLRLRGNLRIIYANLEAERKGVRGNGSHPIKNNLNRTFYKNGTISNGTLEEITASQLIPYLNDCDYVLDIHSTSYPTEPFAISIADRPDLDRLASFTGLKKYVIMTENLASGGSLLDEVYRKGGRGLSFEAGTHTDETSTEVARTVVHNFLSNIGILKGGQNRSMPEKFYGKDVVKIPSKEFRAYNTIKNFTFLPAGTPYGEDNERQYSLEYDCYPFLFSDKLIDNMVFLVGGKESK